MTETTTTGYLILGLLATRDWSAYELAKQSGRGMSAVWSRVDRQLYYAPKKLVEAGLAAARTEATGRRKRTVYSITPAGREALSRWIATESAPPTMQFEGMVRVLVADQGTIDDLRTNLELIRDQANESAALFVGHAHHMASNEGLIFPERRHLWTLANRFMIEHFDHIAVWADWALSEIETWSDTTTPLETHRDTTAEVLRESTNRARRRG